MEQTEKPVRRSSKKSSVIYLGHIPNAFEEPQMRQFFEQFGTVKRLRLSRNKKTGASKHYAFIEFESPEVAEIVCNTMNNYILFGHKLKCEVMLESAIHEKLWKGANHKFVVSQGQKVRQMAELTASKLRLILEQRVAYNRKTQEKLEKLGIRYDYLNQMIKEDSSVIKDLPEETVAPVEGSKKEEGEKKLVEDSKPVVKRVSKKNTKVISA